MHHDVTHLCRRKTGQRVLGAVEEHGAGKQLVRFRCWPMPSVFAILFSSLFAVLAAAAAFDQAWVAGAILGAFAFSLGLCIFSECAGATAAVGLALEGTGK